MPSLDSGIRERAWGAAAEEPLPDPYVSIEERFNKMLCLAERRSVSDTSIFFYSAFSAMLKEVSSSDEDTDSETRVRILPSLTGGN
ncbi:hypothetical protein NDU88_003769 [Pleurodeles waltl]|uniref:Uncharacterized protein n=1 Tax=Pleurodeles waltl TaxID=8319 RepID=A0AAV7V0Y8_PLEWA|nr:hypothetical protein NDU88_003769 [Pleurodeles waltl]